MENNRTCFQPFYDYLLENVKSKDDLKKIKLDDLPEMRQYQYLLTRVLYYSELYGKASERLLDLKLKALAPGTHYAAKIPDFKIDYEMSYNAAADYFAGLDIIDAPTFYGDLDRYAGSAYTISRVNSADTVEKARAYISDALGAGKVNPQAMKAAIQGFITANGDDPLHPWHLETVVRTNLNSAFSKGRYLEQLDSPNEFWQYYATLDGRETPLCNSLDGKVFRKEDEFWANNYPPNHFNCRSTVVTADAQTVEAEGLKVEKSGKKYLQKVGRAFPKIKRFLKPGRGFSNDPAKGLEQWLAAKAKELGVPVIEETTPVFETGAEVKDYLSEKYGIRFIYVKGAKCDDVQYLTSIATSIDNFARVHGLKISTIEFRNDPLTSGNLASAPFWYDKGISGLMFNVSSLNTLGFRAFDADILYNHEHNQKGRAGWWWNAKSMEDIVTHELGHHLTYRDMSEANYNDYKAFLNGRISDIAHSEYVSQYGTKNMTEYLAETYVKYVHGEIPLTPNQKSLLNEWMGITF